VLTKIDGGVWFDPLQGDLVRTIHEKPQVKPKHSFFTLYLIPKMQNNLFNLVRLIIHLHHFQIMSGRIVP
jgi:hypothetical protein